MPKAEAETDQRWRLEETAEDARSTCRTLYPGGSPCWECGLGWAGVISDLSYRLETLNRIFMKEFRVHVQADQVKEKFGGLRFYYTVYRDQPAPVRALRGAMRGFADAVSRQVDFKIRREVVEPARGVMQCVEARPGEQAPYGAALLTSPDGGFACHVRRWKTYDVTKPVPGRMKWLWRAVEGLRTLDGLTSCLYFGDVARQKTGARTLEKLAAEAVRAAEKECYSTCESCGWQIGTPHSPRCETTGWTTYLCEKCARRQGREYKKNGRLYDKDGNPLKTPEKPGPEEYAE